MEELPLIINGALSYQSLSEYTGHGGWQRGWRLKESVAAGLTNGDAGGDMRDLGGGSSGGILSDIKNWFKGWFGEILDDDPDDFPVDSSKKEPENLYYRGIANLTETEEVKDDGKKEESIWSFPSLSSITDWALGVISYPLRAVFVGWAQIVQIGVSMYVANISGETTSLSFDTNLLTNLHEQMEESLTIEKLVYNKVPLFDVNVFNLTNAGGKTIDSNSLTAVLRELVANWYYAFRTISLIALLLFLIYLGIKAAASTAATDKATFKSMLVNWLVAFIVVFFMHYIMLFVMNINESLVSMFANIGKSLNLYETVRELTWSVKMSVGITASIIYIVLVYYLIKFLVIYFKRLFVTLFLIIIAPLVAGKYAYDKIRGEKSGTSLGLWLKEFVFSVLMQSIHAMVYTIFISTTINMVKTDTDFRFAMVLLSFLFINFMTKAEKMLRNMLKLVASEGSEIGEMGDSKTNISDLIGWAYMGNIIRKITRNPLYTGAKDYTYKTVSNVGNKINKNIEDYYVIERRNKLAKLNGIYDPSIVGDGSYLAESKGNNFDEIDEKLYKGNNNGIIQGIYYLDENGKAINTQIIPNAKFGIADNQLDKALREEYHMRTGFIKDAVNTGAKVIGGMAGTFIGLPITVAENPLIGAGVMIAGIQTIRHAAGKPIKGYQKTTKKTFTARATRGVYTTMSSIATAGATSIVRGIKQTYGSRLNEITEYKAKQVGLIHQARNAENNMMYQVDNLRNKEFKGFNMGRVQLMDPMHPEEVGNQDNKQNQTEVTLMDQRLAEQYEEQLITNIEESQKTVQKATIKDKINEYERNKQKFQLSVKDLDKIAKKLTTIDQENPKNNIIITKEIEDNIRAQISADIITGITDQTGENKVSDEAIDTMIESIEQRIGKVNGDNEEGQNKKNAMELSIYILEQSKSENDERYSGENKEKSSNFGISMSIKESTKEAMKELTGTKVYSNVEKKSTKEILNDINTKNNVKVNTAEVKEEDIKQVHEVIHEAINEDVMNDALKQYDAADITDLMKKAVNMEGSIEKSIVPERFKGIIKEAEKIRDVNEELLEVYERRGEKDGFIYKKEDLIANIKSTIRGERIEKDEEEER